MDLDEELARAFRAGVADLTAPVAEIATQSGRLGRRRQRLRRLRAGSAVLAVAALGLGALLTVGPHGGQQQAVVSSTPVTTATTPSAHASTEPADTPLTPEAMVKLLTDQLPPGGRFVKYQDTSSTTGPFPEVGTFLSYDDGHGVSEIQLVFRKKSEPFPSAGRTPGIQDGMPGCDLQPRRPSGPPPGPISCHAGYLADGSWAVVTATDAVVPGLYGYRVTLWQPTGYLLVLSEYSGTINAYGHKEATTRQEPPVPLDRWQAIADSPEWQPKVPRSVADAGARLVAPVPHAPFPEG
ncbi:hypothetical protein ABT095_18285 [Kitasatospora sp. NPDC002227]|uniref:hypothetical protein n=1 Tax=Kitasatospora sp. NPDC002227 TaxID=3154773 RepID=UPI003330A636